MLHYRESAQIDRAAWDACVQQAGRTAYGFSWYLDLVSEHWGGLVYGNYDAVFPLPWKQRAGLRWVYTPFFCQQLGVFARHPEAPGKSAVPATGEWLRAIPRRFRKVDLAVGGTKGALPLEAPLTLPDGWSSTERPNFALDLSLEADALRTNYETNTRRNLKKAQAAGLLTDKNLAPAELLALIREHQGPKLPALGKQEYNRILAIMEQALSRGLGTMIRAFDPATPDTAQAGAYFLHAPRGPLYLFGTTTPAARQNGAMTLVFDALIVQKSGQHGVFLDFEGSAIPGLARFYQGFGAAQEPYHTLHMRRFPLLFKGFGR